MLDLTNPFHIISVQKFVYADGMKLERIARYDGELQVVYVYVYVKNT